MDGGSNLGAAADPIAGADAEAEQQAIMTDMPSAQAPAPKSTLADAALDDGTALSQLLPPFGQGPMHNRRLRARGRIINE